MYNNKWKTAFKQGGVDMKFKIGDISLDIDVAATEKLYSSFSADERMDAAVANFKKNIDIRRKELEETLMPFGINPVMFRDVGVDSIDVPQQSICYIGYYPFIPRGDMSSLIDEIKSIYEEEEDDGEYDLPIMMTDLGVELSLHVWEGYPAFFFEVDMPWLFSPPTESSKYENTSSLPEIFFDFS